MVLEALATILNGLVQFVKKREQGVERRNSRATAEADPLSTLLRAGSSGMTTRKATAKAEARQKNESALILFEAWWSLSCFLC
jgi:hypothetical protein